MGKLCLPPPEPGRFLGQANREKRLSSKIADFTTEVSAQLLLDILYAAYFAADYDKNWDKRLQMTRQAELYRHSDNQIMKE